MQASEVKKLRNATVYGVAALLLLVAQGDLPSWYFWLLRLGIFLAAVYAAWCAMTADRQGWTAVFAGLAVVFNPVLPVYLGRPVWRTVDALAAAIFVGWVFMGEKNNDAG